MHIPEQPLISSHATGQLQSQISQKKVGAQSEQSGHARRQPQDDNSVGAHVCAMQCNDLD